MKRKYLLSVLSLFLLAGCNAQTKLTNKKSSLEDVPSSSSKEQQTSVTPSQSRGTDLTPKTILNGGFENADLTGWTVEYGNAFTDECVTSESKFSFSEDPNHHEFDIGKAGNWFLDGRGYNQTYSHGRIGAIRSSTFKLGGTGMISIKLAGGALTTTYGKGDLPLKDPTQRCYVGFYTASDDQLVYRQENKYFTRHTEVDVPVDKYEKGVCHTDNFAQYTINLVEYYGQEMYIRIVDNDTHHYYGYLSVDDIRIGGEAEQATGPDYTKERYYVDDVDAPSQYEIKNGDFECGSLAGWTVLEGLAFSNEGVNAEATYWNENITYDREGNYHYGYYKPTFTGVMRSSEFILGGSGFVSFRLGGCRNNDLVYLSFYVKDDVNGDIEVARYSNRLFWNFQFPFVPNGLRHLNLVQYVADVHKYIGRTMYIQVVDNSTSGEAEECIVLDSIKTYWESEPTFYTENHYYAYSTVDPEVEEDSKYQVKNGTFETGDLTGWTTSWENDNDRIGRLSDHYGWWVENLPYNKKGNYLFTGMDDETKTGYLKSSTFEIGGIGKMSFLFGAAKHIENCYISLHKADNDEELARYSNRYFHDIGIGLVNHGSNMGNMVQYVADLNNWYGEEVYLKIVDNGNTNDWNFVIVDGFITYYADENALPNQYYDAKDILPKEEISSIYQVTNGGFETGDMTGWTTYIAMDGSESIGGLATNEIWWNEWFSFDMEGNYFYNGWNGREQDKGIIESSSFTVGGINKMSFRLGGGKNTSLCYIEIVDVASQDVLATYGNYKFNSFGDPNPYIYRGEPIDLANDGYYMGNMVTYIADLSAFSGQEVKIVIHDNAVDDWGLIFVDDFVTYYENEADLPAGFEAKQFA